MRGMPTLLGPVDSTIAEEKSSKRLVTASAASMGAHAKAHPLLLADASCLCFVNIEKQLFAKLR